MAIAISGGRLALSGNALAIGCSCCVDCCTKNVVNCRVEGFGVFGLVSGSNVGWRINSSVLTVSNLPRRLPVAVQFRYPDSTNCSSALDYTRSGGNVVGCFSLSSPTSVRMSVSGAVEQQNAGFDAAFIEIRGTRAQIGSFGRGLECAMTNTSSTKEIQLDAGVHVYTLVADTVDALYHVNMVHTFVIEEANPLP
jgi:hypothetical protein